MSPSENKVIIIIIIIIIIKGQNKQSGFRELRLHSI